MKRRILSFTLCIIMILSSVPFTDVNIGQGISVSASAVNLETLQRVYDEIPAKPQWEVLFVDSSTLKLWYDIAEEILASPDDYEQKYVDGVATSLKTALDSIKYHTTDIALKKTSASVNVGETLQLEAVLNPENAADTVTWTSSNDSKVTVSSNGLVTVRAYSAEAVTITATSNGHSATCKITTLNPLAGISLYEKSKTLYENQMCRIYPTAVGVDSTAKTTDKVTYTYYSDNSTIASVTETGFVTALSEGTATITVTATNGKKAFSEKFTVTVKELIAITGFKVQSTLINGAIEMTVNETEEFKVTVTPSSASEKNLLWTSSNPSIASVSQSSIEGANITAKIKALKAGETTITYSTTDGSGLSGYFVVSVKPLVTALSISETTKVVALTSKTDKLTVTAFPTNAGNQKVLWTTDDPSICDVDMNGVLEPVSSGLCTISATTTDGSAITVSCRVRVAPAAASLTINKSEANLKTGEKLSLKATITTVNNTTYNDAEWTSSNTKVATVDENGVVTAVGPGKANIKAITRDGTEKYAVCVVNVTQPVTGVTVTETKRLGVGGKTALLTATVLPSNATNKEVKWSTSDSSIATVDSKGLVTSKNKVGTCQITCTTVDGSFKASCTVSVEILTTGIKLNKSSATIKAGNTLTLTATVSPTNATDKSVKWKTSSTAVATVKNGVVTAVAGGTCTITATASSGQTATCEISVTQGIDSITLSRTSATMYVTQTMTLTKTVKPSTSTVKDFAWSSSNTSIATVSTSGVVTAKAPGEVTISVTADGKTAECVITVVKKVNVSSISLESSVSVNKGDSYAIEYNILPQNASEKGVTWSSSDKSVVTVSSSGIITAVAPGKAVITGKTKDGGYTDTCNVTVIQPVTGIRMSTTDFRIAKGKSKTVIANVFPSNATNTKIKWTSSNTSVATVNSSGLVTGQGPGSATITATTADGGYTASCNVVVYVAITGIKLTSTKLTLPKGEKRMLTATISPSNATDDTIKWTTSNNSVATVDSATGQVTGKATGTAVITATSSDGNCKASCTVTVVQLATSIKLDSASVTLVAGKSKILKATMKPSSVTNKNIKWTTSSKSIVKVTSSGKITAVSGGTATVKATSGDGKVYATCKVVVLQPVTAVKLASSSASVKIGKTVTLKATVSPSNASNKKINWTSSNETIATVSSSGVVKGIKKGTATITATTVDGSFKATCKVNVTKGVTGVSLDKNAVTLSANKKIAIVANVKPSSASNKKVTWSSNNKDVATVDSNGIVTAKSVGIAEITAKTKDGGYKAKCLVVVIQPVKSVKLNSSKKTLDIGETSTLKATVSPSNATTKDITWSSSDKKVAKVSSSGKITALKAGTATISVKTKDGGHVASCKVTVLRKVRDIAINKSSTILYLDKTTTLKATIVPSNATNQNVTWSSSDENIVRVSSKGKLTPVKPGTAKITVKTEQGGLTAVCTVKVERAAKSLALSKKSLTVKSGSTYNLSATISPSNTTNKTLTWTSSNTAVATVNSKGQIKAIGGGTATITCKTSNGISAKCSLTVTQSPTDVKLNTTETNVYTKETVKLTATVLPSSATDKGVTWTSSNKAVATVSSNGTVTGVKSGKAVITVKTNNGGFTASCTVTVLQHATSVKLSKTTLSLAKGKKSTLTATVLPSDATNKAVTWSSSNSSIISVSQTGEITALKTGKADVVVTSVDKKYTAKCSVTVFEPVTGISIDVTEKTLFNGDKLTLNAAVSPTDATNKLISFTSSNSLVASVSSSGVITALKSGEAVITATTNDGAFKASCKITVLQKATSVKLDKTTLVINAGETTSLKATVNPSDCYNKEVTWETSDETIVSVDSHGSIVALLPGTATVTATSVDGSFKAVCRITVNRAVTAIEISHTKETIYRSKTLEITATLSPFDATNKNVVWKSSDELVAKVKDGVVTAISKGTANIIAESEDGGFVAVCVITVIVGVEEIKLDKTQITINEGDEETLTATVLPEDAENKNIVWESSNQEVATVENGKVSALTKGEATIYAKSQDNESVIAQCVVTVTKPVTAVSLDKESGVLYVGQEETLTASVLPQDASCKDILWSSSDNEVATVEDGKITALKRGNATITATTVDGGFSAEYSLEVKQAATEIVFESESAEIVKGDSKTLSVSVLPENTNDKTLSWSSSNSEIATVENGVVTAHKSGTATITATAVDGGAFASILLVVTEPATKVEILGEAPVLWVGESATLSAKVEPETATYKDVTWQSNNESVATVDENGTVSAISDGVATITAVSHCKKASDSMTVTVRQQATSVEISKTSVSIDENGQSENGTYQLSANVLPSNAHFKGITWTSENDEIATVSSSGLVTAISKGETYIVATSEDTKASVKCLVKVVRLVTDIEISQSEITVEKGKTAELSAVVTPSDATDTSVRWISENENIATVDENGLVTAVGAGKTRITAISSNEDVKASCLVNVEVYSESISLDKTETEVWVGDEFDFIVSFNPDDVTNKNIIWSTDNDLVLGIGENGKFIALKGGEAIVKAKTEDTGKEAQCNVKVSVKEEKVELSQNSLVIEKGEKETLTAVVSPENATYKDVEYSSSNDSVAAVNQNGEVSAVAVGQAVITVKTKKHGKTDSCTVNVIQKPTAIVVSQTKISLDENEQKDVSATFTPADTTEKDLIWQSSEPSVATVENGKIKALSKGTAIITVRSAADESVKAEIEVTVIRRVTAIEIAKIEKTVYVGKPSAIEYNLLPADVTDKKVNWTSSDEEILTVDENGNITAKKCGMATVFAQTSDGGFMDFCLVTVVDEIESIALDKASLSLEKKGTYKLKATVAPKDAVLDDVKWISENEEIATVENGLVTAKENGGKVVIKAVSKTDSNVFASCEVTVIEHVSTFTLSESSLEMRKGESETIEAIILPSDATDKSVSWRSDNEAVATVDSQGKVTAVSSGSANIVAVTKDGQKEASCAIKVFREIEELSLSAEKLTVKNADEFQLTVNALPSENDETISFESSDISVLTVDSNGKVTAIAGGTADIIATSSISEKRARITITVLQSVVSVSFNEEEYQFYTGNKVALSYSIEPATASNKKVSFRSSNEAVVKIDEVGNLNCIAKGESIITVITQDGEKTAQCVVKVLQAPSEVELNVSEITLGVGKSMVLTASALPSDSVDVQKMTWKSDNTSVAEVDQNGKVTAKSKGVAKITVTTWNGVLAVCTVTVS